MDGTVPEWRLFPRESFPDLQYAILRAAKDGRAGTEIHDL